MTGSWFTNGNQPVRPSGIDVVVSLAAVAPVVGSHFRTADSVGLVTILAFAVIGGGILLMRRRWPIAVLLGCFVVVIAAAAAGATSPAFLILPEFALFTVANQTDRRTSVVAGIGAAVALYAVAVLHSDMGWDQGASLGVLAWTGLFAAAGDATRNRRSYVAAVEERARKAEADRDSEAARQVAEERLRIARELHDVLAHHIAVIHVHAGLADATMDTSPQTSRESLGHIRQAAGDVLGELGALMQVLRATEDTVDSADRRSLPAAPVPSLRQLDELIDSQQRSGSPISFNVSGKPEPLPPAADLAAYRIIQEALTNAGKHGVPGTAALKIRYDDGHLDITVTNLVATDGTAGGGTGHGLIGMRERAASVGASLRIGQDRGIFVVEAGLSLATVGR